MKKVGIRVATIIFSLLFSFVFISYSYALSSTHLITFNGFNLLLDNNINSPMPITPGDSWTTTFINNSNCRIIVADNVLSFRIEPKAELTFPTKSDITDLYTINVSSEPNTGSCLGDVYRTASTVYPAKLLSPLSCQEVNGYFKIIANFSNLIPNSSYYYSSSDLSGNHKISFDKNSSTATTSFLDPGSNQTYSLYNSNSIGDSLKVGSVNCISNQKKNVAITNTNTTKNNQISSKLILYLILGSVFLVILSVVFIISLWMIFEKAGIAGIKSIIPIYNLGQLFKISGMSNYWSIALLIPGLDIIALFMLIVCFYKLGSKFNKKLPYKLFLVFVPIISLLFLAFSDSDYKDKLEN